MFNLLYSIMNQELFEVTTMKIQTISESHHVLLPNRRLSLSAKMNGTQRRTLVRKSMKMHCTYCGMPKGTCPAEATSNSKKSKPVALAIIELHLSEGIGQSVTRKFHLIIFS